jgi:hypothetical protein
MNAEGGIDDLLRNGVLRHTGLPYFLAKSPRRKETQSLPQALG